MECEFEGLLPRLACNDGGGDEERIKVLRNGDDNAKKQVLSDLLHTTALQQDCRHLNHATKLVKALLLLLVKRDKHYQHAAKVFRRLEPWKDESVRNVVLRHIAQLYTCARDKCAIFRKFKDFTLTEGLVSKKVSVIDAGFTNGWPIVAKVFQRLEDINNFFVEATLLSFLSHENIIKCYGGACVSVRQYCIVMERMDMDLSQLIGELAHDRTSIVGKDESAEELKFDLFKQMIEGLIYLHSFHICHRDIKPANIMVKRREQPARGWQLKLIDVGVSRAVASGSTCTFVTGSAHYMPPEVKRIRPGEKVEARMEGDIYGLGHVISELWFSEKEEVKDEEDNGRGLPPALRTLINSCLAGNWAHRPTAKHALELVKEAEAEWRSEEEKALQASRPEHSTASPESDEVPEYSSWILEDDELDMPELSMGESTRTTETLVVSNNMGSVEMLLEAKEAALLLMSRHQLQERLRANNQPTDGGKSDLQNRIRECVRWGCQPICPQCRRLMTREKNGEFDCPGNLCWTFVVGVTRKPWTTAEGQLI